MGGSLGLFPVPEGSMRRLKLLVLLALLVSAACAADAQAAIVTVGSPLLGTFMPAPYGGEEGATYTNLSIDEPGTNFAASPVDGRIVSWSEEASEGPAIRMSVLRRAGGTSYAAVGMSAPQSVTSAGENTFPADLPIEKGDLVGLDIGKGDFLGVIRSFTGRLGYWEPQIDEGIPASIKAFEEGVEVGVNVQVQPSPTITGLGSVSGPPSGGTTVLIAGTDFEGASVVRFGSTPASNFTVDSEGQISAVAPAAATGPVTVSVTTIAGTATSSQQFTYQDPVTPPSTQPPTPVKNCTVPKLKGKTLKASKTKIKAADCKVGKVTKRKGAKATTGKVVGQSKKPGTVLPAGTVVKVTLGRG
jgi:hypothetical protein